MVAHRQPEEQGEEEQRRPGVDEALVLSGVTLALAVLLDATVIRIGRVVGPEYLLGTAPFQDQVVVRALVLDFLSHHARMLIGWADRTDAILDTWPTATKEERVAQALHIIRDNLAQYPPARSHGPL